MKLMTENILKNNNENERIKIRCQQLIEKVNLVPEEV